jgi:putative ABC transport system permease protein
MTPPRLALWLLERLIDPAAAEAIAGDLIEELPRHAAHGRWRARRWFWGQILSSIADRQGRWRLERQAGDRRTPAAVHLPDSGRMRLMNGLTHDLRVAFRSLIGAPVFTITAVLTLALGIGAAAAIGTAANLALMRPLPYPHGERLVHAGHIDADGQSIGNVGFATALDWRTRVPAFDELAIIRSWAPALAGQDGAERLSGMRVSWTFLRMLGVAPAIGRDFRAEDDAPVRSRVVLISDALWRRRFGARPDVVGSSIALNGAPHQIVGVMPASFEPLISQHFYARADIWAPLGYVLGGDSSCRTCQHLKVVARLRPDATAANAATQLATVHAQLRREHPSDYEAAAPIVRSLHDELGGVVRQPLRVLLAAVVFVLLVSCANVAGLQLARGAGRQQEMAVRAALGAGTARLVRQLMTESLLLAAVAGMLGLLLARWGLTLLAQHAPVNVPRLDRAATDPSLVVAAAVLAALALVGFGLMPAWTSAGVNPQHVLREGRQSSGRRALRARELLMTVEVAIALVLVVGAALMYRTVDRLLHVDPGFDPRGVVSIGLSLVGPAWTEDSAVRAFQDETLRRVRALPGVESVALTGQIPLGGNYDRWGFRAEDRTYASDADVPSVERYSVTPDYFRVMRIPIREGRLLAESDVTNGSPVMVVSDTTARTVWPGERAVGKRVRLSGREPRTYTVVGVVGDVRHYELGRPPTPQFYVPQQQITDSYLVLVARSSVSPGALVPPIRRQIAIAGAGVPVYDVATLDDRIDTSVALRTFLMRLLATLAAVGMMLSAVGLYGVIAQGVAARRRELSIRLALGATRRDVALLVLRRGLRLVGTGMLVGLAGAAGLGRFLGSQLYQTEPTDPGALAIAAIALIAVALAAHVVPLRRATAVDPGATLRLD